MDKTTASTGPLHGVRVLDLTRALAGPVCTMILGDMGADVIKVEEPLQARRRGTGSASREQPNPWNRNKRSITLNLRTSQGQELFRRLVRDADVVVENYRPGFLASQGLAYEQLKRINPRLVLTSISGYGQTGPNAARAAFDTVGQAMGGLMAATGPQDAPPIDAGAAVSDITAGVFGALGTSLALHQQRESGRGQHVDASLVESIVFLMGYNLALHNAGQHVPKGRMSAPERMPGAGCFQTADGHYEVVMAQSDQHWPRLARLIGRADLAEHADYRKRAQRALHGPAIDAWVRAWVAERTLDEVERSLAEAGIPFGKVQSLADLLDDPHLNARNRFYEYDFRGALQKMIAPYPLLSETPGSIRSLWPELGEHNAEIYSELLGLSPDEIEALSRKQVI